MDTGEFDNPGDTVVTAYDDAIAYLALLIDATNTRGYELANLGQDKMAAFAHEVAALLEWAGEQLEDKRESG